MFGFLFAATLVAQSFFGGLPVDGIQCNQNEGVVVHIHADLQMFDRGHAVPLPAQIGMPASEPCLYWLHTHTASGMIHIESPVRRTFTLGQFFDVWGQTLSRTQAAQVHAKRGTSLRFTINGKTWNGDPRAIPLRDHERIVIQAGPPFSRPAPVDWNSL